MKRDQLIAVSDSVPASVRSPVQIGALRNSAEPELTWIDEAGFALGRGERVVLTGDILHEPELLRSISELKSQHRDARFALLLHWSLAIASSPSVGIRLNIEAVYVVIDEELSEEQVALIDRNWHAQWVLLSSSNVNWSKWIPTALFPQKQGQLLVLAPDVSATSDRLFLSPDELRVVIAQFSFEHPLIRISAAPSEWFIATEIGPWEARNRRAELSRILYDNRSPEIFRALNFVSIVVPFRIRGDAAATGHLKRCLESIEKTFPAPDSREIVLAIDQAADANFNDFQCSLSTLRNFAIVQVPRFGSENDWRAGFVRNVGESITSARGDSFLLFVDSDVAIVNHASVREATYQVESDLLQLSDHLNTVGFEHATSKLLGIRRELFQRIGGFADAFSSYGCEDNLLVYKAQAAGASTGLIPKLAIEHLRSTSEDDDLIFKMLRLRKSASLMYRMTLDPRVHLHFYVSLGANLWTRALLKRLAANGLGRFAMGFFVFILTLFEADKPLRYIRGFYDVVIWKLKRPVLWSRANSWKLQSWWNHIEWRYPELFITQTERTRILTEGTWLEIRAYQFGWRTMKGYTIGLLKFLNETLQRRIVAPGRRIAGELGWRIPVGLERFLGAFLKYRAILHGATIGRLRAQSWIFSEPTAWFSLNLPIFYRFVWKPLLKARYFLEYHLSARWRKS